MKSDKVLTLIVLTLFVEFKKDQRRWAILNTSKNQLKFPKEIRKSLC